MIMGDHWHGVTQTATRNLRIAGVMLSVRALGPKSKSPAARGRAIVFEVAVGLETDLKANTCGNGIVIREIRDWNTANIRNSVAELSIAHTTADIDSFRHLV